MKRSEAKKDPSHQGGEEEREEKRRASISERERTDELSIKTVLYLSNAIANNAPSSTQHRLLFFLDAFTNKDFTELSTFFLE